MGKRLDISPGTERCGLVFIRDVESNTLPSGQKPRLVRVKCTDCNKSFNTLLLHFIRGRSRCKCKYVRHGEVGSHLHNMWRGMINRCDPNYFQSKYYFDKGITVCKSWTESYLTFKKWALSHGYSNNLQIDRKNNKKGYNKSNCKWATTYEQSLNRSCMPKIKFKGVTKTRFEWAKDLNISSRTLKERLDKWPKDKALTTKNLRKQTTLNT